MKQITIETTKENEPIILKFIEENNIACKIIKIKDNVIYTDNEKLDIIKEFFNKDLLIQESRKRECVYERQLFCFLCYKFTILPTRVIGNNCRDYDHATVLHSHKTINNLIYSDKITRMQVNKLEAKLNELGITETIRLPKIKK